MLKLLAHPLYYPRDKAGKRNRHCIRRRHRLPRMCTHPSVFMPNPQPPVTLAIRSAFLLVCWLFLVVSFGFSMDQLSQSPIAQQAAFSGADSPHSSQNREFSASGTAGENSSMAASDKSPSHVTSDAGNLHSVNPAGQGTDYTIIDLFLRRHST